MNEPRDPIDEWLGADVEPLQPPPGTFAQIHRTARRRRAIRAISTAAGAAIVIAAAVTLPQVATGLLPGHGGPEKVVGGQTTSPSRNTSHPGGSASPTSSPSHTIAPPRQAGISPLGSTGQTHRAAPGFRPTSVTFVGRSTGAVVGQADCPAGSCTSVAGTPDYGQNWFKMGAPPAGPPNGGLGVRQIRFLDTSNGWIYGPELYATHDGGLNWKKIGMPGRVIDLSAVGSRAFAVIAYGCTGTGRRYAASCTSIALMSTSAQDDRWRLVPGASTGIGVAPGGLQLTGQYGYLMTKGLLYAGPVTGGPWHAVSNSSPSAPACVRGGQLGPWLLAPGSPDIFLACDRLTATGPTLALYRSSDQGVTWRALGPVAESGTANSLAVAPASGWLVLATSKGIYYSTDHKSWHRASLAHEPAGGFSYVGMTTTLRGVAVPVNPGLREVFITSDGGLTWQARIIR